jgi:hypothetical protein
MNTTTNKTAVPPVNPRFLHSLALDDATLPGGAQKYWIGGLSWYGAPGALADSVWRLADGRSVRYVKPTAVDYEWRATFNIGGSVWMDVTGEAATLEEACAEAMDCTGAPIVEIKHAGVKTPWHQPSANVWMAAIDGDAARIFQHEENFFWSRKWALGDHVLVLANAARELEGIAPSLEAAMCAAIDAPETFKRACAALVAGNK